MSSPAVALYPVMVRGRDVVGDGPNPIVDWSGSVGHHIRHVGDGVAVEITGSSGNGPVFFRFGTICVGASCLSRTTRSSLLRALDGAGGQRGKCSDVQQNQNDSGN